MLNKKILIAIIVCIFLSLFSSVSAYNLTYQVEFNDVQGDLNNSSAYIYIATRSYTQDTIDYHNTPDSEKDSEGYINEPDEVHSIVDYAYHASGFTFHKVYESGDKEGQFMMSSNYSEIPMSATTAAENTVYYDVYGGIISNNTDALRSFYGAKASVPEGQHSNDFVEYEVDNGDGSITYEKYKVVTSADGTQDIRVDVHRFSSDVIMFLNETYMSSTSKYSKYDLDLQNIGLRFSRTLATGATAEGVSPSLAANIYTPSTFFQITAGSWGTSSRGMIYNGYISTTAYGTYEQGGSALNHFDNILLIPNTLEETNVYVNYVDEDGIPIDGMSKTSQDIIIDGLVTVEESQIHPDFHEYYTIGPGEELLVKPVLEHLDYTYTGAKRGESDSITNAKTAVSLSPITYTVQVNEKADETRKEIIINFVYSKASTTALVRHVDENGDTIDELAKSSQQLSHVDTNSSLEDLASGGSMYAFQESYVVPASKAVRITPNNDTSIGDYLTGKEYEFVGFRVKYNYIGSTLSSSYYLLLGELKNVSILYTSAIDLMNARKENALALVEIVYQEVADADALDPLTLVGQLAFINNKDSNVKGATDDDLDDDEVDYIPAGNELKPYIIDAYPYVVRALDYDRVTTTPVTVTHTVTMKQPYSYEYWTRDCGGSPLNSGSDEDGNPTSHTHTDSCWGSHTNYGEKETDFTFTYTYQFTYYDIQNFKMFRIKEMTLVDSTSGNIGGTLFEGGDTSYTINMSNSYNNRFNNSSGLVNAAVVKSELTGKTEHELNNIHKSAAKGTSASSAASSAASAALAALDYSDVGSYANVKVDYEYHNDYIELDGEIDMLDKNTISKEEDMRTSSLFRSYDATMSDYNGLGTRVQYTANLEEYMKPTTNLTNYDDFVETYLKIPETHVNGMRVLEGSIEYELVTDSKYNIGSDNFRASDYTYTVNTGLFPITNLIDAYDLRNQSRTFLNDKNTAKTSNELEVNKVNVINPLNFASFELITDKYVDHSTGAGEATVLQKGAEFTIDPEMAGYSGSTKQDFAYSDTTGFVQGYFMQFDFDIIYLDSTNGAKVASGNTTRNISANEMIEANTAIYLPGSNSVFKAKTEQTEGADAADQITNEVRIVAVSYNITDELMDEFYETTNISRLKYQDEEVLKVKTNENTQNQPYPLLSRNDIMADAYHAISTTKNTINVGRIYDFAVTDCNDLAFKDVFREINDGNNVNESTNTAYYSGYYKWIVDADGYNTMMPRTEDEIGTYPATILPLGPYKHTGVKYVNAPKLGYRISFDLKTSGYINTAGDVSRKIEITPSYYYISKDGKTFDDNISLYYKNSSGNYINFQNSGYTIYFTPNDGYRYLRNAFVTDDIDTMSTKMEPLNVSSTMILDGSMMSTNNSAFIQSWYGEYKLPNSTIAFSNNTASPNNNINNPYTDGYIGVIFNISYVDDDGITVSYNTNDKQASGTNTTQWDYEGYLGFKTPGEALTGSLKLQLERDIWTINDYMYNQIKGTVALFDIDNRAADDFQ